MHDDAERLIAWLRLVAIPVLLLGHGLISETRPSHRAFTFAVVAFALSPLSIAGLPRLSAIVCVEPPLFASAARLGFSGTAAFPTCLRW